MNHKIIILFLALCLMSTEAIAQNLPLLQAGTHGLLNNIFLTAVHVSDCSSAAKKAANSIVQQNAEALNLKEVVTSVKRTSSSASGQIFTVTSQQGDDNTYEWSVETSNNCQVSLVRFIGGL